MPDDLRTRIARVLYEDWWHVSESWHEPPRWEKLSDAARDGWLRKGDVVIRELGLKREDDRIMKLVYPYAGDIRRHRWVTEWTFDPADELTAVTEELGLYE